MSRGLVGLALVVGLASCEQRPATAIVLAVDSELGVPAELDQVIVRVEHRGKVQFEAPYALDPALGGHVKLPATLVLLPGAERSEPVLIRVSGQRMEKLVVERSARLRFIEGRSLLLLIHLLRGCIGLTCPTGETCTEKGCVPIDVDPATLPEYDPKLPLRRDAGAPPPELGPRDLGAADPVRADLGGCGSGPACAPGLDCVGGTCKCIVGGQCGGCCAADKCITGAGQSTASCGQKGEACRDCNDNNECTTDTCSAGACAYKALADGTPCSGGKTCLKGGCGGCSPSCSGKQCGGDGCGGSCGECTPPKTCNVSGQCVCIPTCAGKNCGDDGCGDVCGNCTPPLTCGGGGVPGLCGCTPNNSAACSGKSCGSVVNNCGQTISCGSCTAPQTCGGGGTPNVCGCAPDNPCAGKNCGSLVNSCGQSVSCGPACTSPNTCGGGGTPNVCGCTPNNPCAGKVCGNETNSCGQSVSCGSCSGSDTCGGGQCWCCSEAWSSCGQEAACQAVNSSWHRHSWGYCNACNGSTSGQTCDVAAGQGHCGTCFLQQTCP